MIILFLLFFLSFNFVYSNEFPSINGCFCEGGIITGLISNNDQLKINNKEIVIFENGKFIYAFGRKSKNFVKLDINGKIKEFAVKKKKYKIENIKGLPRNKVEPSKKEIERILIDKNIIKKAKEIGSKKKLFEKKFILPAQGRLSGVYGSQRILNSKPRSPHAGIDLAAKEGTKVVAPSSGIIKIVSKNMFFTGNTIIMDHGLGLISIFAHLKEISVKQGEYIKQGQKIGTIGMTGRATGPHLHWGVYLEKKSVDPFVLVNFELD